MSHAMEPVRGTLFRGCIRLLLIGVLIAILIPCGIVAYNYFFMMPLRREVAAYKGDGKAEIIGKNFINYGYAIYFEPFDLSKDFHAEYKIGSLPRIDKGINANLRIYTDRETIENLKSGHLSFELVTLSGDELFEWSASLDKWTYATTYSSERESLEFSAYYYSNEAPIFFNYSQVVDKGALLLKVTYVHGLKMTRPIEGCVLVDSGGSY